MTIRKTVLVLTILHPADVAIGEMSLTEIAYEIDTGESIGHVHWQTSNTIPSDELAYECTAVGSDISFFED